VKRIALKKALLISSLGGIIIPSILFINHSYILNSKPLGEFSWMFYFFLWPSSIVLRDSSLSTLIFSMVINSLYYLVIGFLLWFGINKSRLVLYVSIGAFVLVWGSIIIAFS